MQTATTSNGAQKRQVLASLAAEVPGLRLGGARARLFSFAAWPLCEMIALVRYRSAWREEPRAAIRRTVLLLPVVVLVFSVSAGLGAAELAIAALVIAVLLVGPGWVRVMDARRAGLSVRAMAPLEGRARIAAGFFWAYPPGRGQGRRLMGAVLSVADAHGVVIELRASCWRLVRQVYEPAWFMVLPGQERAVMPKLRRVSKANTAQRRT
ncbi:MAG TPA: hypothetical protein VGS97_23175 [Actinocrinis sp.]|uniref:hypothetical protein n=1 Tax=Actinocrinis sp. TaxID=1920516 RepID=UPI002DDD5822|nr:hypothetical protein [Actinocrinis sp.]HEV2347023.1 hypothetical protein [Actinocrinis sp.]